MLSKLPLIILLIALLSSCSNELDLISESDPYPVIYGVIAPQEDRQFIRVEKSFIDESQGATILAQNPENLYYDDAKVYLTDTAQLRRVELERVNAEDFGYSRKEGIFATSPNYIYTIETSKISSLLDKDFIEIQLIGADDTILASSVTEIIKPVKLRKPRTSFRKEIFLVPSEKSDVTFREKYNNVLFDVDFEFFITELNEGVETQKRISWRAVKKSESKDLTFDAEGMYNRFIEELEINRNIERSLDSIYLTVYGYGESLKDYYLFNEANDGITASSEIPIYTNIENGYGFFTSQSKVTDGPFTLNDKSHIELTTGAILENYNFK